MTRAMKIEDIKKEEGKVNAYLFWGKGCPHCEIMNDFLNDLDSSYTDKFNLYSLEVWYDKDNADLMMKFADHLKDEPEYVPYLIIGENIFTGVVTETLKEEIKAFLNQADDKTPDLFQIVK